nr:hypothetical protein BaRGS_022244 [Batillaria attramentaria]
MRLFVVLATFACSLRTSGGQGFPGLFDMDFGFAPQLPVSLPDVTNSTRWADVTEAMLEEVAFHCGWVRFCNSTGWKELYEPRYGCHSMFYTDFGDPTYALMIDKCPEGHSYENGLVEKCENASLSGLEGHWPVVSIQTKSVYRSIHCAKCNEDAASVLKWDVKIQCLDHVHLDDTSSQKAVLDKVLNVSGCHVSFDPPQGFQLHACQSVSDEAIISTCNATGERHLYDELMWKACETFHSYVKGFRVSFQNIFCALCNYEVADLSSVCPRQFPFPFVVVMSADALSRVTSSGTDQCTCQEGELYDVYEVRAELKRQFLPLSKQNA